MEPVVISVISLVIETLVTSRLLSPTCSIVSNSVAMLAHHRYRRCLPRITYEDSTGPRYKASLKEFLSGDHWRIDGFSFVIFPSDSSVFPNFLQKHPSSKYVKFLNRRDYTNGSATLAEREDLVRDYHCPPPYAPSLLTLF